MTPHHDAYPDPTTEASARLAEAVAAFATLGEVLARVQAERLRRAAVEERQYARHTMKQVRDRERREYEAARAVFDKAHDRQWLHNADLLDLAHAWKAAGTYADHDPGAAKAITTIEEQLRQMYDGPMRLYDHLREAGYSRADAMKPAAAMMANLQPYAKTRPHGTQLRAHIEKAPVAAAAKATDDAVALGRQGFAKPVKEALAAAAVTVDIQPPKRRMRRQLSQEKNQSLEN